MHGISEPHDDQVILYDLMALELACRKEDLIDREHDILVCGKPRQEGRSLENDTPIRPRPSAMNRWSAQAAITQPPAMACPLTAATTGRR